MLPGGFVWDISPMSALSIDDAVQLVERGEPFGVAVDADRCEVMWGVRWSRVWCTPSPTSFGPGWVVRPSLTNLPLPLCGGAAAAGPEGPESADDDPSRTRISTSLLLHPFHAPSSAHPPQGVCAALGNYLRNALPTEAL